MKEKPIRVLDGFKKIRKAWSPKIIDQFNDNHIKIAIFHGDFTWHAHKYTDEVFMVLEGCMTIEFRDERIELSSGDLYVIEKGREHKPSAIEACKVMIIEPIGTINTGNVVDDLTTQADWI